LNTGYLVVGSRTFCPTTSALSGYQIFSWQSSADSRRRESVKRLARSFTPSERTMEQGLTLSQPLSGTRCFFHPAACHASQGFLFGYLVYGCREKPGLAGNPAVKSRLHSALRGKRFKRNLYLALSSHLDAPSFWSATLLSYLSL
jgi:hypothetical protein